ncbi:MAG: hypothetical protein AB8H86_27145 [Polyangiales bacterium]
MDIAVQFIGADVEKNTEREIRRRTRFALDRLAGVIRSVSISVKDQNGPRGGVDQRCVVDISLRDKGAPVVAQALSDCPKGSVAKAVGRARRQIEKRVPSRRSKFLRAGRARAV